MTEQEKRESVIKEFKDNYRPYSPGYAHVLVRNWAVQDAIDLLKTQKPEAMNAPKPDSDIGCWYDITHNYTLEQVVNALEAQEPIKPVMDIDTWKCGNCGHVLEHQELLGDNVLFHEQYNFCPECGRAMKWK